MRALMLSVFTTMVVLLPIVGNAQGTIQPTPAPEVTATSAQWFVRGEPIVYGGNLYYASGPDLFFDGKNMSIATYYQGVPLYADAARPPYSVVLVPVGGRMMRPYEPRANVPGVDNRAPQAPRPTTGGVYTQSARPPLPVGTGGTLITTPAGTGGGTPQSTRSTIETIPAPPKGLQGIWIEFEGARWFHDGAAVSYNADRFTP